MAAFVGSEDQPSDYHPNYCQPQAVEEQDLVEEGFASERPIEDQEGPRQECQAGRLEDVRLAELEHLDLASHWLVVPSTSSDEL